MKQGWELQKIEEVCLVFEDGDWVESKDQSQSGIRLIQTGNVGAGYFKDREEKARYISEDTFKKLKCTEIFENDCLISRLPDPVGRACVLPKTNDRMITAVDCSIIRFNQDTILSKWFLFYSLSNKYQQQINSQISGATRQRISRKNLGKINIPIPSLPEQQKIIAILDKAFSAIEQVKQHAEQNLKNAKELFNSYLESIFDNKGDGWEEKTLGQLSKINYGYTESASFDNIGPKFLRITDIQENGVKWDTVPYCKCSDADIPKYKLHAGDIVFARTGATTGKSYLIHNPPNAIFASYLIRLKLISISDFVPKFVAYYFNTKTYWNTINSGISGSAQGGFNASKLGELNFPFPTSLNKQQLLVDKLDALSAETQQLETIYQQKLTELDDLKKSILQKAFNGELN